jgi:glycine dehydrogenase subunit 1
MPFIPHTENDVHDMLHAVGVPSIDDLFDEIPKDLRTTGGLAKIPAGISEMEIGRLMMARAEQDGRPLCFMGAGAYDHHIPAAVWEIATRGEFYSSYTPYQAEASQGTLQLLYEYQTMMASLTGMDVSNASLYDGASALAEAVLMAVRANRRVHTKRVLMPSTVHPVYRKVVHAIVKNQGIDLIELPYCGECGHIVPQSLAKYADDGITALVIPQPNFFGVLEDVDALTDWAHQHNALVIGVVNPISLAVLASPGEWGGVGADDAHGGGGSCASLRSPHLGILPGASAAGGRKPGADIVCGEGQPLGAPLSSGGPYFGFLCCKQEHVRQMPGRIVGRTVDLDGKPGFTLTLQAREQHIRRSKATSNICTNQGLVVTAATIHMSLLGADGLERVAAQCHGNTWDLIGQVTAIPGITKLFDRPLFHEAVLQLPRPAEEVLAKLAEQGLIGGYNLRDDYPELGHAILICATETKTAADIETYTTHLRAILTS